ncbi:hypothetical protein FB382_003753 [Nocardioides ginsengisegetis]|uniref:Uncharacterized protein n=2 Tax=Nocardioides ginsengisegetis TaxID=661491 RepID=A0A7W3J3B5_9ACTN|nr:hypothetical protein [Nocardioides ginsengisegetis]
MAEQVARSQGADIATPQPPRIKHCWVTDRHGRLPGLLLEWRQLDGVWRGRVLHPIPEGDGWIVVEEWLSAELLERVDP